MGTLVILFIIVTNRVEQLQFALNRIKSNEYLLEVLTVLIFLCSGDQGYGEWVPWSSCSLTCGGGTRRRTRSCNSANPSEMKCIGNSTEVEQCNTRKCPSKQFFFLFDSPLTLLMFLVFSTTAERQKHIIMQLVASKNYPPRPSISFMELSIIFTSL